MSIESLKQQARRHEQDEQWQKALDQYQKAIRELEKEEQTDIGLLNRVGDLFVRVGKLDQAVEYYGQAVDLYREAFLPNNAIAVCKKIIRNLPNRHEAYLKIGQIRAEQGFLSDARTNFLMYAERMQKDGQLDESFRALVEFCDLAPDDVEVRVTVADQMAANQRKEEAVAQLLIAYGRLKISGESDLADGVEKKILDLDPNADLTAAVAATASDGMGAAMEFGEIEIGGSAPETSDDAGDLRTAAEHFVADSAKVGDAPEEEGEEAGLAVADEGSEQDSEQDEEGSDFDLPMMSFDSEEEGAAEEEEGAELPMMSFGEEEEAEPAAVAAEEEAADLPTFDTGDDEATTEGAEDEEEAVELPTFDVGEPEEEQVASEEPGEFAAALEEAHEEVAAERPPEAAPPPPAVPKREEAQAPEGGYVDFGAMILGGGGGSEKKTTRFKVAYEEPSGDEAADFAKMLSQFKEKVSENIDAGDVRAHHDLGTAYKEMGLLQEAISAFQAALRASPDHLPTYEMMGQTFIEMGQPDAAVRTLQRALKIHSGIEDEFVGIYYYLARAYEALDNKDSAVEFYDRVFSLDINFADVTERLRELR
ncbi:MAG TPA: tetratricopeptide repeat protein [Longimicrobiales bacterium]|nr:tetratricopeptide repeat protein [Longimicrobiales bacterium]